MDSMMKAPLTTHLRRMFYFVTPNETSFEKAEDVPQYIKESAPFFLGFIAVEFIVMLLRGDGKRSLNDGLTSVGAGMFSRLPLLLFRSLHIAAYIWVHENFPLHVLPWDSPYTWWLCFLGMDLGYYWFHRLAHEVNFMWAAHQVHHSSEYYNFTTALRQSVLQGYTSWVFYLPMAPFIPPSIFILHHELNILYQFWIHTEYVRSLGPLEYVLNTPSHHRVHHGRNRYCIDKNYAGTLIIWDRLFGTFEPEAEEVVYGLTHPLNTFDQFWVQFGFLKYMIERFNEMKGPANKLCTLFFGPGWAPGKPRTGELSDIPDVHAPEKQYNPQVQLWLKVYVVVHFFLTFLGYQLLFDSKQMFCQSYLLMFIMFLGYSLTTYGRLFDRSNLGIIMEVCRCVMFLVGDIVLVKLDFYTPPTGPAVMPFLRLLHVASLGLWLILYQKVFDSQVTVLNKNQ
ncbi:alkylglycerol monooxygenase-like [Haliotis rufescens]|uniref:alkylglycerol monooxygenase-like n=1 Tax=Haliotis rufescens TaxID=6454 RepID=UPI001EB06516|nr:alkylglycerol monooxygenase-like [Haliotis rufescens]